MRECIKLVCDTYLLAKAAEGAGGGVFPEGILEKEPLLSEADSDIRAFECVERD